MSHRAIELLAALMVGAFTVSGAMAAEPARSPASYKALPKGAMLDYGSWQCRVDEGSDFQQVCRDSSGNTVTFYGKFVPVGALPNSGYGTGLTEIWCGGLGLGGAAPIELDDVVLSKRDRAAVKSLWPLEVGKEISFLKNFRPIDGKAQAKIRVTDIRTATVLGRSRKVYVLEGETTRLKCANRRMRSFNETWLYDAALGAVVHYELKWVNNPVPGMDIAYSLKQTSLLKTLKPKPKLIAKAKIGSAAPAVRRSVADVVTDTTGPTIQMSATLKTSSPMVEIAGRVQDAASQVVELTVGKRRIPIAGDGTFRIRRAVRIGTSTLVIAALDEWGNRTEKRITVKRRLAAVTSGPAAGQAPNAALDPFSEIHFGNYYALVIGNNTYANFPSLKMAIADADAISTTLREDYGFKVEVLTNATRGGIIGSLAKMRAKLKANDNLLIYYAGHGVLDNVTEVGYWLPVDAQKGDPSNWISTTDITTMIRAIRAKHVMVVADSCYSGTLTRAVDPQIKTNQERVSWVTRMSKKRSRTALVSGGLEPVLDSGGSGHSVFAQAFLDALAGNTDVMEGSRLYDRIKRPVALNSKQTPSYSDIRFTGHEGGDFLFVRRNQK